MRHIIQGRRWTQKTKRLTGYWGWCKLDEQVIEIAKGQTGSRLLETLIHEWLHAELPKFDEDSIDEMAKDGVRFLEKNGLGFVEECECGKATPSESLTTSDSKASPRKSLKASRTRKNRSTKPKASRQRPGSNSTEG